MYERVLLPTDGTPGTERAVEHALDVARQYGAELHVLYVADPNALPLDAHAQRVLAATREEGRQSVREITERAEKRGVESAVGTVREGPPAGTILDYADEHGVDLIVMGTHGRLHLDRYLGSVTDRVVRKADVPVLTVRMEAEGD
jgi:nucleotide-binding universal stress UspA family protein